MEDEIKNYKSFLLALSGWRLVKDKHKIQCVCCLRSVDLNLLHKVNEPFDEKNCIKFDCLAFHYNHCYFSNSKHTALRILAKLQSAGSNVLTSKLLKSYQCQKELIEMKIIERLKKKYEEVPSLVGSKRTFSDFLLQSESMTLDQI